MSPIERAARAICAEHAMYDPDMMVVGRDNGTVPYWTEFARDVRAVLLAIREPSEGMIDAVVGQPVQFRDDTPKAAEQTLEAVRCSIVWTAMIDAALAGEGE